MTHPVHEVLRTYVDGGPRRATLFIDLNGKVPDFAHLADEPMVAASVMKLPLAMASVQHLNLGETVAIADLQTSRYCSIWSAFTTTKIISVGELINFMLIVSDNPATVYLAEKTGFAKVNQMLRNCNCSEHAKMMSCFDEANMSNWRNNVLTAYCAAKLLREIASNPIYKDIRHVLEHNLRNHRLAADLPDDVKIAHKTGSMTGVANDIGLIRHDGQEYILVCLSENEPVAQRINCDMATLALNIHGLMKASA